MALAVSMFRWLDLLEKEFDKAFVQLDVLLGDVDDDPQNEFIVSGRQKLTLLSSSFAELAHKSQTIFQMNAKLEVQFFVSCFFVSYLICAVCFLFLCFLHDLC